MRLRLIVLASFLLTACAPQTVPSGASPRPVLANDNRLAAGTLQDGVLKLRLEVTEGNWQAESALPSYRVLAFAEAGKEATVPGPLIRVPQGTLIELAIHSGVGSDVQIHGLHARPGSARPLHLQAHATVTTRFRADVAGTYYYWGSLGKPLEDREGRDSELTGALIVDALDAPTDDRIFVISRHGAANEGGDGVGAWTINGRSWPDTERLTYRVGEPVAWRWINATGHRHPMHLHGTYFRVASVGDNVRDVARSADEQNLVVTQSMRGGSTMTIAWSPARSGNWLFHCHVIFHVMPENRIPEPLWYDEYAALPHDQHMAGLVLGIHVPPANATASANSEDTAPRKIGLRVGERDGVHYRIFDKDVPGLGYALDAEPATAPGPALVLERGRPVEIEIANKLTHVTSVHWHGIELESYYDGVPHWGGDSTHVTPYIEPGGNFTARFTPPRAGTFIYHTHFNDFVQLTTGLYGALIIVEPGETLDTANDHVFIVSHGPDDNDPLLLNGAIDLPPTNWRRGQQHRLRLIGITAADTAHVRLVRDGQALMWRPLAKDGADLSSALTRDLRSAVVDLGPGETYDFEVVPDVSGTIRLEAVLSGEPVQRVSAALNIEP